MLDETTLEGKAVAVAMKLAAERDWSDIGLRDIADAADANLADVRAAGIASKTDILVKLLVAVDDEVLRKAPKPDPSEAPRDRLFEVLMARFDALEPYKAGLKSIAKATPFDAELIRRAWSSQGWMLEAAGISSDGLGGGVKAAGLATVYAQVFRIWLEDDDPGLARTMAALDRRLRRGEQVIGGMDDALRTAKRFGETLTGIFERVRQRAKAGTARASATAEPEARESDITFPDPPEAPRPNAPN